MRQQQINGVSKVRLRSWSASRLGQALTLALVALLTLTLTTISISIVGAKSAASASGAAPKTGVVALRAKANNKFVTAENAGNSPLIANRTSIGTWETFDLIWINSTDVQMRSHANGKFVCAEAAGTEPLVSNRDVRGPWETFQLITNIDGTTSLRAREQQDCGSGERGERAADREQGHGAVVGKVRHRRDRIRERAFDQHQCSNRPDVCPDNFNVGPTGIDDYLLDVNAVNSINHV